ncbi:27846_t:CDS:2 [Gigaspora margarita]|uniref:27846_t:CDS:1 n=1 Tax=Gigaspora margarita TaxID=4874 RepID=A0ABN7UHB7_GIGMA|nr:27846_t:CDS:2 [Gigaspora margarita]
MFKSEVSNMVPCYGISQDPEGNYIMVMEYMKQGNLRDYLKKNYKELDFKENEYEFYQQLLEAEQYNKTLPDEIKYLTCQSNEEITQRLQQKTTETEQYYDSGLVELTIPAQELTIQEDQEQFQAQQEIPPK